ncbi:O-antigen ligase family protein [Candidatus Poribacteria bacterium]
MNSSLNMGSINVLQSYRAFAEDSSAAESDISELNWKEGLIIAALIWGNALGTAVNAAAWLVLIIWSLTGTSRAVRAMIIGYVLFALNPVLFSLWPRMWILRWFLLLSASLRVFHDWNTAECPIPKWLPCFLSFVFLALLSSLFKSYALTVSLFKLFAFTLGFTTIALGVELTPEYNWRRWIYTLWAVILVSSLPLIPLRLGYVRNGNSFQGILNHPQEYGIFFAIPAALLIARLFLDREERAPLAHLALLIPMLVTIVLSQTRTAVLAIVLTFLAAFVISLFRRERLPIKPIVAFYILIVLVISIIYIDRISDSIDFGRIYGPAFGFLTKGASDDVREGRADIGEGVFATRTQFIAPSLDNFRKSPLVGTGFGIASDSDTFRVYRFHGIPVSATIEKGFIFSALLEETGILGTVAFIVFIVAFTVNVFRYGKFSSYMFLLTAFLITFGEMGFFSPGAIGPYIWFCMAIAAPKDCKKEYLDLKWT